MYRHGVCRKRRFGLAFETSEILHTGNKSMGIFLLNCSWFEWASLKKHFS